MRRQQETDPYGVSEYHFGLPTHPLIGTEWKIVRGRATSVALAVASFIEFRHGNRTAGIGLGGLSAFSAYRSLIDSQVLAGQRTNSSETSKPSLTEKVLGTAMVVGATLEEGMSTVNRTGREAREALTSFLG